jgi:hypothetical protein
VFKKNKFLFLSILIHLIAIYVATQSVMFPSVPDSPSKKLDIIQATLIFDLSPPPPESPLEETEEELPLSVVPKDQLPVADTPADKKIQSISGTPAVQAIPNLPQTLPQRPEEEVPVEPEKNKKINEFILTEQTITPIPSSEILTPESNMARRHLNSFQQKQRNRIAEQASRYFQQHKNSPVINDEVKNPFMTEDEKLMKTIKVRVDCSSMAKKLVVSAAKMTGGRNIKCSTPPPITSFIQDRINKETLLPGQYQQENQEIPQSIVIQKQH